jgi:hypothetical protein
MLWWQRKKTKKSTIRSKTKAAVEVEEDAIADDVVE